MNLKQGVLLAVFLSSGCAHYFKKNEERKLVKQEAFASPICISLNNSSQTEEITKVFLDESHARLGKVVSLIKEKYPAIQYDCKSTSKTIIFYSKEQENKKADLFFLTLGIVPLIAKTDYMLMVEGPSGDKIYESKLEGQAIMSIFFAPFFFLHDWEYETVFEEIDRYLQIHLNSQNNLK